MDNTNFCTIGKYIFVEKKTGHKSILINVFFYGRKTYGFPVKKNGELFSSVFFEEKNLSFSALAEKLLQHIMEEEKGIFNLLLIK